MGVRVYDSDSETYESGSGASSSCCDCCCCCNSSSSGSTTSSKTKPPKQQQQNTASKKSTEPSTCKANCRNSTKTTPTSPPHNRYYHSATTTIPPPPPPPTNHYHHSTTTTYLLNSNTATAAAPAINNFQHCSKDFIGNAKEFRIENNKNDLRIIGNNNRIRIGHNTAKIHIIGNNTRLKITANDGSIQYTGNEGRICLGNESQQQTVNYIGCNGTLKLVDSQKLNAKFNEKCKKSKADINMEDAKKSQNLNSAYAKVKVKSASYGGEQCKPEWQQLNELLHSRNKQQQQQQQFREQTFHKTSMPNLANTQTKCNCKQQQQQAKHCQITNNFSIVNNLGNILINNAVNISV